MAIQNGVVKSNNPILLKEKLVTTDGRLNLRSFEILELGEKERQNSENGAIPSIPFKRKVNFSEEIFGAIFYRDIPKQLIVNLDQASLSYVIPGKYTFDANGVKMVLIKGIDN